jgi:hypothetical protein
MKPTTTSYRRAESSALVWRASVPIGLAGAQHGAADANGPFATL